MLVHTFKDLGENAEPQALLFQAILAVDRGYTSTLRRTKGGWRVTASDGKFVDFLVTREK